MNKVLLVIPAYNEEKNIERVVDRLMQIDGVYKVRVIKAE